MKQKKKIRRKVISYVLAFVMVFSTLTGIVPGFSVTAYAASATYIDGSGTSQTVDAIELAANTTSWTNGSWYIVPEGGLTIGSRITVNGTVNLILRDGATLTASAGITTTNATLNIYAQGAGTGALIATGSNGGSAIGGSAGIGGCGGAYASTGGAGGTVSIFGGTVTATGGNATNDGDGGGAGIGGGGGGFRNNGGAGGTVSIFGGTVTATGGGAGTGTGGGAGAGIGGGGKGYSGRDGAVGTLTLGKGVKLYNGTDNNGAVLNDSDDTERSYNGSRPQNMFAELYTGPNKTDLNTAIAEATTFSGTLTGTDYSLVKEDLDTAITAATNVKDYADATQEEVDAAVTALNKVLTEAKSSKNIISFIRGLDEAAPDMVITVDTQREGIKQNAAAFDALSDDAKANIPEAVQSKLAAYIAAVNGYEFREYKSTKKNEAGNKAQEDDSDKAKTLIDDAKEAIDKLTYDTTKTLDENKAAVDAVITKLDSDLAAQRAVDAVSAKINALPEASDVTADDKTEIEAARVAYNALSTKQQTQVGDAAKAKLEAAEDALAVAEVVDAINKLPAAADVTTANKTAIEAARTAYDKLTSEQQTQVGDAAKAKLEAVEVALAIAELPGSDEVTVKNKTAIEAARTAYDKLTSEQQTQVGGAAKAKLEAAEDALAVAEVVDAINKLPAAADVTTANKKAIEAARAAYDALTDKQKDKVIAETLKKLTDAEDALAAATVSEAINKLPKEGEVEVSDTDAIVAARNAFDKLTDAQKNYVSDEMKQKLEKAENALVAAIGKEILSFEEIDEENMDEVKDALDSYDKVSDDIKNKIDAEIGRSGVKKLSDLEKALAVADRIAALKDADEITSDDEKAVTFARTAYELLNDSQKAMISEDILKKLEDAEAKLAESKEQDALADEKESAIERLEDYAELKAKTDTTKAEQEYYVDAVASEKEKINAAKDKDAVADALKAAKKAVDDALAQIDKDRAAAKEVAEKINALPESDEVTTDDKEAIEAARKAYDALTENQKKNIPADVLKKLTDDEKKLAELENKETGKTVDMYRLYNPNSGEHFYTASAGEKDSLVKLGWKDEGIGWQAPEKSNTPVYRLYNPNSGDHHYTTNKAEKDNLVSVGWKDEGIGWYSDDAQSLPIYRQYNPNAVSGAHNFTSSKGENDWLVSLGWKGEGIGWYGVK